VRTRRATLWSLLITGMLGLTLALGCQAGGTDFSNNGNDGTGGGNGGSGGEPANTYLVTVPAPDGDGDAALPAPGVIPTSGCTGEEPPPPPGTEPDCDGGDQGPVRGVFLEGVSGTLESDAFVLAEQDGVTASAAGCLLSAADATSGGAALRMVLCNGDGAIWDVTGTGTIEGNAVTVTSFEYPEGTSLGGLGTSTGGLFYLDTDSTYTLSQGIKSGTMSAALADSRAIGTEIVFTFDLTAANNATLAGTFTVVLDKRTDVFAPAA